MKKRSSPSQRGMYRWETLTCYLETYCSQEVFLCDLTSDVLVRVTAKITTVISPTLVKQKILHVEKLEKRNLNIFKISFDICILGNSESKF